MMVQYSSLMMISVIVISGVCYYVLSPKTRKTKTTFNQRNLFYKSFFRFNCINCQRFNKCIKLNQFNSLHCNRYCCQCLTKNKIVTTSDNNITNRTDFEDIEQVKSTTQLTTITNSNSNSNSKKPAILLKTKFDMEKINVVNRNQFKCISDKINLYIYQIAEAIRINYKLSNVPQYKKTSSSFSSFHSLFNTSTVLSYLSSKSRPNEQVTKTNDEILCYTLTKNRDEFACILEYKWIVHHHIPLTCNSLFLFHLNVLNELELLGYSLFSYELDSSFQTYFMSIEERIIYPKYFLNKDNKNVIFINYDEMNEYLEFYAWKFTILELIFDMNFLDCIYVYGMNSKKIYFINSVELFKIIENNIKEKVITLNISFTHKDISNLFYKHFTHLKEAFYEDVDEFVIIKKKQCSNKSTIIEKCKKIKTFTINKSSSNDQNHDMKKFSKKVRQVIDEFINYFVYSLV